MQEYKEFCYRDFTSRIRNMEKTRDMMNMGAEAMFEGKPMTIPQQAEMVV